MNTGWSDELIARTIELCTDKTFSLGNPDGVCFKSWSDQYGFVRYEDALKDRWLVHIRETDQTVEYDTIDQLVGDGWVLD